MPVVVLAALLVFPIWFTVAWSDASPAGEPDLIVHGQVVAERAEGDPGRNPAARIVSFRVDAVMLGEAELKRIIEIRTEPALPGDSRLQPGNTLDIAVRTYQGAEADGGGPAQQYQVEDVRQGCCWASGADHMTALWPAWVVAVAWSIISSMWLWTRSWYAWASVAFVLGAVVGAIALGAGGDGLASMASDGEGNFTFTPMAWALIGAAVASALTVAIASWWRPLGTPAALGVTVGSWLVGWQHQGAVMEDPWFAFAPVVAAALWFPWRGVLWRRALSLVWVAALVSAGIASYGWGSFDPKGVWVASMFLVVPLLLFAGDVIVAWRPERPKGMPQDAPVQAPAGEP